MQVEPNFRALGERLGKAMGPVGKAVKALGHDEIAAFLRDGRLTVAGHELGPDDVRISFSCL
jgi:isoleucyl-tRNA synthetase